VVYQKRFAHALASMVDLGLSKLNASLPITKVVKNLCAFLCSDPIQTPAFDANTTKLNGVLSFKWKLEAAAAAAAAVETDEITKARISRRGAEFALTELSVKFGDRLIEVVPMIWESTTDGLLTTCGSNNSKDADSLMGKQTGQDVIDSLVTLQTVVPSLHEKLWDRVMGLLPPLLTALKSRYSIVRQAASKCLAVICNTLTLGGMRFVVEQVLPLLGDAKSITNRQGGIEVVFSE
jgi:TATA-binding protein-associated factor